MQSAASGCFCGTADEGGGGMIQGKPANGKFKKELLSKFRKMTVIDGVNQTIACARLGIARASIRNYLKAEWKKNNHRI